MGEKTVRRLGFWESYLLTVPCFFVGDLAWSFYENGIRGNWGASARAALIGGIVQGFIFAGLEKIYRRSHAQDGTLLSSRENATAGTETHLDGRPDAERRY